jgi:hypothetical protein
VSSAGESECVRGSLSSRVVSSVSRLVPCFSFDKTAPYALFTSGGRNRTLHLFAVPAGNRTAVLTNAETYPTQYRARFSNEHWLLFGGLQDWGPCHLTKENSRVGATARWREDTREDTLSLRRTIYSDQTHAAVDVKGKFLGTYPYYMPMV